MWYGPGPWRSAGWGCGTSPYHVVWPPGWMRATTQQGPNESVGRHCVQMWVENTHSYVAGTKERCGRQLSCGLRRPRHIGWELPRCSFEHWGGAITKTCAALCGRYGMLHHVECAAATCSIQSGYVQAFLAFALPGCNQCVQCKHRHVADACKVVKSSVNAQLACLPVCIAKDAICVCTLLTYGTRYGRRDGACGSSGACQATSRLHVGLMPLCSCQHARREAVPNVTMIQPCCTLIGSLCMPRCIRNQVHILYVLCN